MVTREIRAWAPQASELCGPGFREIRTPDIPAHEYMNFADRAVAHIDPCLVKSVELESAPHAQKKWLADCRYI